MKSNNNSRKNGLAMPVEKNSFEPKIKPWGLLTGIALLVKAKATLDVSAGIQGCHTIVNSLKLKSSPRRKGAQLILNSFCCAVVRLVLDTRAHANWARGDFGMEALEEELEIFIRTNLITIESNFFSNPEEFPFLASITPTLESYLGYFGFNDDEKKRVLKNINREFVISVHAEWCRRPGYYDELLHCFMGPFSDSVKKQQDWDTYRDALIQEVRKHVFSGDFSLEAIYIPLRACYKEGGERNGRGMQREIVVDLEQYLFKWAEERDRQDALRIIHAGPGDGKSSCLKMLAASLARQREYVVFVPLHLLDLGESLEGAIEVFLRRSGFNPAIIHGNQRLILIFDGLDELVVDKKLFIGINSFFSKVERMISNYNINTLKLQVILSGRDIIIQQLNGPVFNREGQVLRLLCYHEKKENFIDTDNLLQKDQRNDWWKKFGEATGKNYQRLPPILKTDKLDALTIFPLSNFLVALSFEKGNVGFTYRTNLNDIYKDLLTIVYEKGYVDKKGHPVTNSIQQEDFYLILEEVAFLAWQKGEGRMVRRKDIDNHFRENDLSHFYEKFMSGIEEDKDKISLLLMGFYFRQLAPSQNVPLTFEFTHKSFSEYLTAQKMVRFLRELQMKLGDDPNEEEIKKAFELWIRIFGFKAIDEYLISFVGNEIELMGTDTAMQLHKLIVKFLNYALRSGIPVEVVRDFQLTTYMQESEYAVNVMKALFVIHGLLARDSYACYEVQKPFENSFIRWVYLFLVKQREDGYCLTTKYFNNLDVAGFYLRGIELSQANLSRSRLQGANLNFALLEETNLSKADVREATLMRANLAKADLSGAKMEKANLRKADLSGSNLEGADLNEADLTGVNLNKANLNNANLLDVILKDACISDSDLTGVNLDVANLTGSNLSNSRLNGMNLIGVKMNDAVLQYASLSFATLMNAELICADLSRANLIEADLSGANLMGADLTGACLIRASLVDANLCEADLSHADLTGANLSKADLSYADLTKAILVNADLRGANLTEVIFPDAFESIPGIKLW